MPGRIRSLYCPIRSCPNPISLPCAVRPGADRLDLCRIAKSLPDGKALGVVADLLVLERVGT